MPEWTWARAAVAALLGGHGGRIAENERRSDERRRHEATKGKIIGDLSLGLAFVPARKRARQKFARGAFWLLGGLGVGGGGGGFLGLQARGDDGGGDLGVDQGRVAGGQLGGGDQRGAQARLVGEGAFDAYELAEEVDGLWVVAAEVADGAAGGGVGDAVESCTGPTWRLDGWSVPTAA